jgi:hypothetical protein
MENIKQRVIWYSNITHLHVQMKWDIELKMEGSKCYSQMGWCLQKPICKISIRIIKPLKTSWKEVFFITFSAHVFTCAINIKKLWLNPYVFTIYISNNENKSHVIVDNRGMENIKQRVIWYSNITHLHVQMKWDIELKMEGNKCCSQMGWCLQKPICKIFIRIIKPLKTSWKEVAMDIIIALLSWDTCSTRRSTYLRTFILAWVLSTIITLSIQSFGKHWDNVCKTGWRWISWVFPMIMNATCIPFYHSSNTIMV